ncbi:MAG TPA: Clp protease N-terminal domain-containing protein [Kineosporiaceae bacterium]
MFERFTPHARHVVVLAQEEARRLQHHHIGTEHILLGLLGEPQGPAGRVLQMLGMSLPATREQVAHQVPPGERPAEGHVPFTPRSKKLLERSLREAIHLGHNYIGTEHILLGLIGDADGVGAQIVAECAGELGTVRKAVLDNLPVQPDGGPRWVRTPVAGTVAGTAAGQGPGGELRTTPAADSSLTVAQRIAGSQPVGSHHLLAAALSDPRSAAARALADLGLDLDRARRALREVDVTGTADEPPEEAGRRHMIIRPAGDRLILETTDPTLLDLAHAALEALDPEAPEPTGTIRGDLPVCSSLGAVWQALRTALEDIHARARTRTAAAAEADDAADQVGGTRAAPPDPDRRSDPQAG